MQENFFETLWGRKSFTIYYQINCFLLLRSLPQLPHFFFFLDVTMHLSWPKAIQIHFSALHHTWTYPHWAVPALLSLPCPGVESVKIFFASLHPRKQINPFSCIIGPVEIIQPSAAPQLGSSRVWDSVLVFLAPLTHCSTFSKWCQYWGQKSIAFRAEPASNSLLGEITV